MPTDADFLRAIIADPDADAPRLAYADWLDECGDAGRAEFIRVQCALAALPEDERELHQLTEREKALESAHRDAWLRPFFELLDPDAVSASKGWWPWSRQRPAEILRKAEFQRGLVDFLDVDTAAFLKHADELVRMTPLRGLALHPLTLTNPAICWSPLVQCPALAALVDLKIGTHRVREDEMREFVEGQNLEKLQWLALSSPGFEHVAVRVLTGSSLLSRLRGLDLVVADASDHEACADLLLREPECKNLESLALAGMSDIDEATLQQAVRTPPFNRLERLTLVECPIGDIDASDFLDWLPPTLTRLHANSVGLGDRAAASLTLTPRLRQLRRLDLSGNKITDLGAMALADSPNLLASTRVDLRGNPISRRVQNAIRIRMGHHVQV
jgi:uncharacterized protein (TIGR02996 family)